MASGQCHRQQDRGTAERRLECQQRLDLTEHIGVVGMHLLNDQHTKGWVQKPQRLVAGRQHGQQRLVHRADAGVSQECAPPVVSDPFCAGR